MAVTNCGIHAESPIVDVLWAEAFRAAVSKLLADLKPLLVSPMHDEKPWLSDHQ